MQEKQQPLGEPLFSEACERNKEPLAGVLREVLRPNDTVLEIGSGTGQHAVHFARLFARVHWLPSDTGYYLPALRGRLVREAPPNLAEAVEIDVRMDPWPIARADVVFSANTLHYMSESCVGEFFRGAAAVLGPGGRLVVYGPFNYAGKYTSASNERFDASLRAGDPARGIRDFEFVDALAGAAGLALLNDLAMPACNRTLVWHLPTEV